MERPGPTSRARLTRPCMGWSGQFLPRPASRAVLRQPSPEVRAGPSLGAGVFNLLRCRGISLYKMSLAVRLELWKNTLGHESGDMDATLGLMVAMDSLSK